MKTITIFLASSITELAIEHKEVGFYFQKLNNVFIDRGFYFKFLDCGNMDDAVAIEGKQEEYNEAIRQSDLCFFLFLSKIGSVTREEFEVAIQSNKTTKKPKILTYFKIVEGVSPSEELMKFIVYLRESLFHYYNRFTHIDSLLLGIITNIHLLNLDGFELSYDKDSSRIIYEKNELLSIENIPMWVNNEELQRVRAKLNDIEDDYYKLKPLYIENPLNPKAQKYPFIAEKRTDLLENIHTLEQKIFDITIDMYRKIGNNPLSRRQVEAYQLFEQGKYKEADAILDFNEILSDINKNSTSADKYIEGLQINVNELLQKIDLLLASSYDVNKQIEMCFKTAIELEEKYNLSQHALRYYIAFLHSVHRVSESISIAERMINIVEAHETASAKEKAELYELLGIAYSSDKRLIDKTIEAYSLSVINLNVYYEHMISMQDLRMVIVIVSSFSKHLLSFDKPPTLEIRKALIRLLSNNTKIIAKKYICFLSENDSLPRLLRDVIDLKISNNNAAQQIVTSMDLAEMSLLWCKNVLDNIKELSDETQLRISIINVLAIIQIKKGEENSAKILLSETLPQIKENIDNNRIYSNKGILKETTILVVFLNFASIANVTGDFGEAERYYMQVLEIAQKLSIESPLSYNILYATIVQTLAFFYERNKIKDKALKFYEIGKKVFELVDKQNIDKAVYISKYADFLVEYGRFYVNYANEIKDRKYLQIAEEILHKATNICENESCAYGSDIFIPILLRANNHLISIAFEMATTPELFYYMVFPLFRNALSNCQKLMLGYSCDICYEPVNTILERITHLIEYFHYNGQHKAMNPLGNDDFLSYLFFEIEYICGSFIYFCKKTFVARPKELFHNSIIRLIEQGSKIKEIYMYKTLLYTSVDQLLTLYYIPERYDLIKGLYDEILEYYDLIREGLGEELYIIEKNKIEALFGDLL